MGAQDQATAPEQTAEGALERWMRRVPIAWRLSLAIAFNAAIALTVGLLGWQSASLISRDIDELRQVQERGRQLSDIDAQVNRLQSLIRQYLNAPTDEVMKEISRRSEDLFSALSAATGIEDGEEEVAQLNDAARRFVSGFQQLKAINAEVSRIYESDIVQGAGEMSGLYAILNSSIRANAASPLAPALVKSHESFVAAVIAINTFYFGGNPLKAESVHEVLGQVIQSIPRLTELSATQLQRDTLTVIGRRTVRMDEGVEAIARAFDDRARILARDVDSNQAIMAAAIDRLMSRGRERETLLQQQSSAMPRRAILAGLGLGLILLAVGVAASWSVGQSVRRPLLRLRAVMEAGAGGDWSHTIDAPPVPDELAAMARTVAVFRRNALDKARLEMERELALAHHEEAKRRILHELLVRMEAREQGAPFARLVVAPTAEGDEAVEIAAAFNRVLGKFQQAFDDRAAAMAQLTDAKEQAEAANQAKSSFLTAVTDEIRAPLDAMLDQLEMAIRSSPADPLRQRLQTTRPSALPLIHPLHVIGDSARI